MKKMRTCLIAIIILSFAGGLHAQKRELTHDDIESWKRITEKVVSPDGEWVAYKTEPWQGDPEIYLYNKDGSRVFESRPAEKIKITDDSEFMIFR